MLGYWKSKQNIQNIQNMLHCLFSIFKAKQFSRLIYTFFVWAFSPVFTVLVPLKETVPGSIETQSRSLFSAQNSSIDLQFLPLVAQLSFSMLLHFLRLMERLCCGELQRSASLLRIIKIKKLLREFSEIGGWKISADTLFTCWRSRR